MPNYSTENAVKSIFVAAYDLIWKHGTLEKLPVGASDRADSVGPSEKHVLS